MAPVIINIYEANSNGMGDPCEVQIYLDKAPTDEDVKAVEDAIADFQLKMKESGTEWETKTLAQEAVEKFRSLGYESGVVKYERVIEIN